jgi:hypothetical protein
MTLRVKVALEKEYRYAVGVFMIFNKILTIKKVLGSGYFGLV